MGSRWRPFVKAVFNWVLRTCSDSDVEPLKSTGTVRPRVTPNRRLNPKVILRFLFLSCEMFLDLLSQCVPGSPSNTCLAWGGPSRYDGRHNFRDSFLCDSLRGWSCRICVLSPDPDALHGCSAPDAAPFFCRYYVNMKMAEAPATCCCVNFCGCILQAGMGPKNVGKKKIRKKEPVPGCSR